MTTILQDQVAVVTGASSGLGRAIALELAGQGVQLSLVGRSLERLETVAELVRARGAQAACYRADLDVDQDIQKLVAGLRRDFSRIDLLVHSAGVIALGSLETAPVQELDWQYRINVRAPYLLTQALLSALKSSQGQIVFINSSAALASAKAQGSQYAATKHALKAIADSLRDEVNEAGIRVLSIYPGRTASPMQAAVHEMEGRKYNPERLIQPGDVARVVVDALCLPRTVEVTNITMRPLLKPSHE